jgi:FixJ family two-component response regulator
LEREIANRPAGSRTHILVAGAAALLVSVGDAVVAEFGETMHAPIRSDPLRTIEAVITGVSFLGAGTIIRRHGSGSASDAGRLGQYPQATPLDTPGRGDVAFPGRVGARRGDMSETSSEATVFIVDDDEGIRKALRALVASVGLRAQTFASAEEFLRQIDSDVVGCVLLDVRMPGMSGFEVQAELAAAGSTLPILMMTAYGEVPMAVRAMRAGAVDFVQKPFDGQALIERIQGVVASHQVLQRGARESAEVERALAGLTPRLRAVLAGLLAGKSSKGIATDLSLSPKTVDAHRARLMERLGAESLPDLFRRVAMTRSVAPLLAPRPARGGPVSLGDTPHRLGKAPSWRRGSREA